MKTSTKYTSERVSELYTQACDRIRQEIEARGITYYRVARDTGISCATLSRFRNSRCSIRLKHYLVLCDYLGLNDQNDQKEAHS